MKKRVLSLALSLIMLLTMLPVSVWAEDSVAEPAEAAELTLPVAGQGAESLSDEDLLLGYMRKMSGVAAAEKTAAPSGSGVISYPAMNTVALSPEVQYIYDQFDAQIKEVAAKGGSTEFTVAVTEPKEYSYAEWNAKAEDDDNLVNINGTIMTWKQYADTFPSREEFIQQAIELFDYVSASGLNGRINALNNEIGTMFDLLLFNDPYELYWYDKTVGCMPIRNGFVFSQEGDVITVRYDISYVFCAAEPYRGTTAYPADNKWFFNTVDSAKISGVSSAITNAQNIVSNNANKNDGEKLQAYLDAVTGAVTYNTAALTNTAYGDPWQLIYVFDGNINTNVVCEGYAKAFKYLCDLTKWEDKEFDCRLVTGTMSGGTGAGPHMWNIVHIGGNNYLVDPTNCDEGTAGANNKLFMREWENGAFDGTYSFTDPKINYTYDNVTLNTFYPEELKLKGDPAISAEMSPVDFYADEDATERLDQVKFDGTPVTVYLAVSDEVILTGVKAELGKLAIEYVNERLYRVTIEDVSFNEIAVSLSGSFRGEEFDQFFFRLGVEDLRPGLVWRWLDWRDDRWQEKGTDRYWEEWLGNEPMGYLYYRDANGVETQLSDEEVAKLDFGGMQHVLEKDNDQDPVRIHLLFDRVGYAAISLPEGQEGVGVAIRVMAPEIGFYADAEGKEPIGLWVLDDSSDTVYLRWAEYIQVTAVERDDGNVTKIEMHPEEHYAAVTLEEITDDWLNFSVTAAYTDPDRPEGDEPSSRVGIRVLDRRPGLRFFWVEGDWYDERVDGVREDDPQSRLVMSPGNTQMIQLAVFDGEKYQIVSEGITLPEGLLTLEKTVEGKYPVLTAVGFGSGEISCTVGNNVYTLQVDITLPQVGFYSKPEASEENYLTDWVYVDGQEDGFYLLWPEGTTLDHWVVDDHSRTRIEVDDSAADDGYLMIRITAFEDDRIGMEVFFQRDDGNVDRDFAWLTIQDRSPGVGLYHVDGNWDNEDGPFTVEEEPLQKTMYMTPNGTALIQVLFDNGNGTVTALKASDVTVSGSVKLHKTVGQGAYLVLEAGSVGKGYVAYTVQDETYRLTVHVELPDVGFYTGDKASEESLIFEWVYVGQDIYLVAREDDDAIFKSVTCENSDVQITLIDDKTAKLHLDEATDAGQIDVSYTIQREDREDTRNMTVGFLKADAVVNVAMPEGIEGMPEFRLCDAEDQFVEHPEVRPAGDGYALIHLKDGAYRLEIASEGCVTRFVDVTVENGSVAAASAALVKRGDLNGADGADVQDMQCLYEYLFYGTKGGALAKDESYFRAVADVNEDGRVNILDYQMLYERIQNP